MLTGSVVGATRVLLGAVQGYAGYSTSVYTGFCAGVCNGQHGSVLGSMLVYVGCSMGLYSGYSTSVYSGFRAGVCKGQHGSVLGAMLVYVGCSMGVYSTSVYTGFSAGVCKGQHGSVLGAAWVCIVGTAPVCILVLCRCVQRAAWECAGCNAGVCWVQHGCVQHQCVYWVQGCVQCHAHSPPFSGWVSPCRSVGQLAPFSPRTAKARALICDQTK